MEGGRSERQEGKKGWRKEGVETSPFPIDRHKVDDEKEGVEGKEGV